MAFIHILAIAIVALVVVLVFLIFKNIVMLIINSVIGLFALFGVNVLFDLGIKVNIWSVLITAIGGIIGLAVVLILHFLHVAF
jgi:hypothetical protein